MIKSYKGKGHREEGVSNHKGCFFISKSTYGPLHIWKDIQTYKELGFRPNGGDFEVIPADTQVCVFTDLDIKTTENV